MQPTALTRGIEAVSRAFAWMPSWLSGVIVLAGSAAVALVLYNLAMRLLARQARRLGALPQMIITRARGPVAAMLLVLVLSSALPAARMSPEATSLIGHLLLVMFIVALGWGASSAISVASLAYTGRYRVDVADNLLARKHLTQIRILQRAAQTLLVFITTGIALMTIGAVRQFGVSLLASAGAAGLVVGLAARPVLSNLLAGIQIAITQPIRLEDAVVVEGEWGWIESITSTYVVIRIWDLRRLVVPLTYFIEKPFQNWTRETADLLGAVILHVDYSVPVDQLREELNRIVEASPRWDRKVVVLQVTDTPNNMVELRALVSARDSGTAWDLRCEVREKLIAFLQREYPCALPRVRAEFTGDPPAMPRERAPEHDLAMAPRGD